MYFRLVLPLIMFVTSSYTLAGAPLGLSWGLSVDEAKSLGFEMTHAGSDHSSVQYTASHPSASSELASNVTMHFDKQHGLQQVVLQTDTFVDNPRGSKARKLFSVQSETIARAYGEAVQSQKTFHPQQNVTSTGRHAVSVTSSEFMGCMRQPGCGSWYSIYHNVETGSSAVLQVVGRSKWKGYVESIYRGQLWDSASHLTAR